MGGGEGRGWRKRNFEGGLGLEVLILVHNLHLVALLR